MTNAALVSVVALGTVIAVAHPFFRFCDARVTRRRLVPRPATARRRSDDSVEHLCARMLTEMARSVRNGRSSVESISLAVLREPRTAQWFAPVAVAHAEGIDLATAAAMLAGGPTPVRRTATQIGIAAATGSLRAATLDRAADMLLTVAAHRDDARAASAHVRLSLRLLSLLPALTVVAALVLQDSSRSIMVDSPGMLVTLVVAAGLNVAGRAWMGRLAAGFR